AGAMLLRSGDFSAKAAKTMSLAVIEVIDLFLVGTVAYITAIGLYKLFIKNAETELPMSSKINTLKDLEDKIIGVIVAALAVAFLGRATGVDEPEALLNYGAGIAVVIAALAFFTRYEPKRVEPGDD
ncbi:MAG: YqhA family protein, partial [Deltaproteobacteria bacterium]|nr:YqhA family protein [Deltaproteobacteria bacterium]